MHLRLVVFLVALVLGPPAAALTLVGEVGRVQDGDSFFIVEGGAITHEVRIAGIDAPEKGQPYSRVAREQLRRLLAGRLLLVDAYKRDRYGRWVGTVSADGVDVGLAQLRAGLAWHEPRYAAIETPHLLAEYAAAEQQARAERTGLWRQGRPTPPWEWRRRHPR